MNRIIRFAVLLLGTALLLVSCQKAPFITMTGPRSFNFTRDGGSQNISFTCNRPWSVSSTESWVQITPSSGEASDKDITVTIKCSPNTTYDPRSATVTVRLEELSESITITQDTGVGLLVSPTSFSLTNAAQAIEIEVQKNVQYSIAIDDIGAEWIKLGGTKALTTDKVTFNISANTAYDDREGKITFKQLDGNLSETVVVHQDKTLGLFITKAEYELSNISHTLNVEITANVDFEVVSQVEWIKYIETKGLSSSTIVLTVDENVGYENRTGYVQVKQKNGDLTGTITVKQAGRIPVTSVTISKNQATLLKDENLSLTAEAFPENAWDRTITWTSSDEAIATVKDGIVTAISAGTVEIKAESGNASASCSILVQEVPEGAVNLGILITRADGSQYYLFWAECNLGASSESDYGDYYAWGEIEPKTYFSWANYKWSNGVENMFTKYCHKEWPEYWAGEGEPDDILKMELEDDAAHVKLGGKWRIPTYDEWGALLNNSRYDIVTVNGEKGVVFKSIADGNSNQIFVPGSGHMWGDYIYDAGTAIEFLNTSLASKPNSNLFTYIVFGGINWNNLSRAAGFPIRPVSE